MVGIVHDFAMTQSLGNDWLPDKPIDTSEEVSSMRVAQSFWQVQEVLL